MKSLTLQKIDKKIDQVRQVIEGKTKDPKKHLEAIEQQFNVTAEISGDFVEHTNELNELQDKLQEVDLLLADALNNAISAAEDSED